jgi:putative copper resistance protein D
MDAALVARGLARGVHVAASLSVFGAVLSHAVIAPAALRQAPAQAAARVTGLICGVIRVSLTVAVVAGTIWLVLEAIYIAGGDRLADGIAVLGPVLSETNFGHLLAIRLALLVLAAVVFGSGCNRGRTVIAFGLAGAAVVLQAALGHGAAMAGAEGHLLLVSLALHLLAAGAWLGGLAPLLISVGVLPRAASHAAAARFSILGTSCVPVLVATTLLQGWYLVGGISGLFGTAYGRIALAKLALFAVLLGFAAVHRFRLVPALMAADAGVAPTQLRHSILAETLVGLLVVILAGILLNLSPNMAMTAGQ